MKAFQRLVVLSKPMVNADTASSWRVASMRMLLTKSCGSASRASLVRFVRSSALARVADDSRSSAASSRSRRMVSTSRWRCRAAPTRPAAISSAETMDESNSRTRCQSSKPMTPTYSPSTRMGTMAEVRALSLVMLTPSMARAASGQNTTLLPACSMEQN